MPPLDYARVYRLKAAHPHLTDRLNGGIGGVEEALAHLAHVDGVMMGRAAYQEPWRLLAVDPVLFGEDARFASPKDAAAALVPYIERELAQGTRLHAITRHLHGLFRAVPGARAYRRHLAGAATTNAGAELLLAALALVRDRDRELRSRPETAHRGKPQRKCCSASALHEILWLVLAILVGGMISGVARRSVRRQRRLDHRAGAVRGAFACFGVPEDVRMQLCLGTSIAIVIPTTIRSYLTHRAKGVVIPGVIRQWALPPIIGVACSATIAAFAPVAVLTLAFVVIASLHRHQASVRRRPLESRHRIARPACRWRSTASASGFAAR